MQGIGMENKKVSIVIPVYNAEKTLPQCIKSILELDYKNYGVTFVDDGSVDQSRHIILSYVKKHKKRIKFIEQKHKGPATARNLGAKSSHGNIIVFTDSDCIVLKNWIKLLLKSFNNNIGAVGGGLIPYSLRNLSERFEQYRRELLYGKMKRYIDTLPACNLAIKREVFEEVGGFDEEFKYPSSEDYELCYRVREKGYKILYDPKISVIHFHSQSWRGVLRRAFIHGQEGVELRKKRRYPLSKEFLSLCKSAVLPFLAVKRYPPKLIAGGFLYDFVSMVGQTRGISIYRRG